MGTNRHKLDHSAFFVKPGKRVKLKNYHPGYCGGFSDKDAANQALIEDKQALSEAQELLWASGQNSVLIIFQAPDAAGKDGAIKHVMSGINPQGCEVFGFKAPNDEERHHDFLWRAQRVMPAQGRITIFNRSYYEEVLVVRVHPEFLNSQWLAPRQREALADGKLERIWKDRYNEINSWEKRATRNGVCIIKFYLNVSKDEQRERLLARLKEPDKYYKFNIGDLRERPFWSDYRKATQAMLEHTSTDWAPWYVIPADKKWFTRAAVADVIAKRIRDLKLRIPKPTDKQLQDIKAAMKLLNAEH